MPDTTQLFEHEKGQVTAYKKCGMSGREISRKKNRSIRVIYKFLKNPKEYDKKKRTGRPPTLNIVQLSVEPA